MRKIHLITVGKLKKGHWQQAHTSYVARIRKHIPLQEIQVKEGPAQAGVQQRKKKEAEQIRAALRKQDYPVALDVTGKTLSSPELAQQLTRWIEDPATAPCFLLGGAYGLCESVTQRCCFSLSLSALTLPHELARIVLLEQLYRALCIMKNLPYHHE